MPSLAPNSFPNSFVLRRYDKLSDANKDVALVFKNAMVYNPSGHPVHMAALKLQNTYNLELSKMCEKWQSELVGGRRANGDGEVVIDFSDVSLKRKTMNVEVPIRKKKAKDAGAKSQPGSRAVSPVMGSGQPNDKVRSGGPRRGTAKETLGAKGGG